MADTPTDPAKKTWYKSKIILLALTIVAVFGGNYLFHFLGANISQEQLDAIAQSQPAVADLIERYRSGESIYSLIGAAVGVLFVVFRAWFTTTPKITT